MDGTMPVLSARLLQRTSRRVGLPEEGERRWRAPGCSWTSWRRRAGGTWNLRRKNGSLDELRPHARHTVMLTAR